MDRKESTIETLKELLYIYKFVDVDENKKQNKRKLKNLISNLEKENYDDE